MNRDRLQGNWQQLKGMLKEKWGKLTNDDLDVIEGRWDRLVGKIQERYGMAQEEVERELRTWQSSQQENGHMRKHA